MLFASPAMPAKYETHSPNGRWVAVADPATYTTAVFAIADDGARALRWRMSGWHRVALMADDGETLVIGADAMGFVPLDYEPDTTVLTFVRQGRVVREIRLDELVPDKREMIRVDSYYWYGTFRGFDGDGMHVRIETASGNAVFDVRSLR